MGLNKELDGILVVSLEQAVAAPYCGLLLADAGARVIKVERPDGDFARGYDAGASGESTIFAWLNRGKESVALDLKDANDMALMHAMLAKADIFLSNLAPGAVMRMGLDGDSLRQVNAGLITCTVTGYGETGAAAQKKAYDFLVQAESGLCSVTGVPTAPSRVGISLTDLSSGLAAFSGLLRALIQRGRTGMGMNLSVAMFDVMADWMNMPLLAHRYMGGAPERSGLQHSFIAPYGAFTCRGGAQVLLSIQSNREWDIFCSMVLHQADLVTDVRFLDNPQRYANRQALDAIVNKCFGAMSAEAVRERLQKAKIANAALNDVAEFSNHEFLTEAQAQIWGAEVLMAALPIRSDAGTPKAVPALGQHGDKLRVEFSKK